MFDRYTPHPLHQVIPFLFVLVGAAVMGAFPSYSTGAAFVAILIISIRTSIWIARVGEKREETEYWDNLGYDIQKLRTSRPEVWEAMGFIHPPAEVVLYKEVTGEEGKSTVLEMEKHTFGLSSSEMNFLANEVISGKRTLAEAEWIGTPIGSTRIRKVKQEMLKAHLIEKAHASAPTQGFIPTESGVQYLLEYASDWAIEMHEQKQIHMLKTTGGEDDSK